MPRALHITSSPSSSSTPSLAPSASQKPDSPAMPKPRAQRSSKSEPDADKPVAPKIVLTLPQKGLHKLGLLRPIDLALHLPLRYEDETTIARMADCQEGDLAQIEGVVTACEVKYQPRRQLLVTLEDESDTCTLRFFNFYPSQLKQLEVGARIRARGELRGGMFGWQMLHPVCKAAGGNLPTALTPVYSTVAGLPQPYLRRAVQGGLEYAARSGLLDETIPQTKLPMSASTLHEALTFLHFPRPDVALQTFEDRSHPAWQRLKAEELLAQQLSQLQSKRERAALLAPCLSGHTMDARRDTPTKREKTTNPSTGSERTGVVSLYDQLLAAIPFALTAAQQRVCDEIARDIAQPIPMNRLLQGDVGSGKTVVAALAAARCIDAGYQCALMAPTEILAEQHFRKLLGWLEPLGITTAWLTGSQKTKQRREMLALISSGQAGLVVGTHAIIADKVQFHSLALAVIDEQHRFGVKQRLALRAKMHAPLSGMPPNGAASSEMRSAADGPSTNHHARPVTPAHTVGDTSATVAKAAPTPSEPHLLMMTATPIPRTLAMSYYADLDVSTIDELPPGRTPIVTKVVGDARKPEVVERIRAQISAGRQVYWVCPLIEESEALDLSNATQTHADLTEDLRSTPLPAGQVLAIGLLHSRMPPADKKAVMAQFVSGQMQLLVSTTVIEVGVDVPNASLMVIEHAERFGLSQLHQLRGRVGRGAAASACVLVFSTGESGRLGDHAKARLRIMAQTNDGFLIAKEDLAIRGPGEFLGARQSGDALLRFADLATDTALLHWARDLAPTMLDQYPDLAEQHLARWMGTRVDYLKA